MTLEELLALKAQYQAQLIAAQTQVVTATTRIAELEAQKGVAQASLAAATAAVADLQAKIADVQRQIDAAGPPPPPTGKLPLLVGCNVSPIPGCPSSPQILRIYAGAQFQAVSAGLGTGTNWGDHVGKRSIAITFNDEPLSGLDGRINTFLNSVPKAQMQGKLRLYVTDVHEPERGDKGNTPAEVRAWTKQLILSIRAWRTAHPDCPNVWANPNYMGWYERDAATAGTSTRDYWPKDVDLSDVVLGIDPYDPESKRDIDWHTEITRGLWAMDGGKRYMINEVNTKRTGAAGATWWNQTFANVAADGCEAILLFLHESAGKNAPWRIDATSAKAFDTWIKAHPV